jgi:hypothetical protein
MTVVTSGWGCPDRRRVVGRLVAGYARVVSGVVSGVAFEPAVVAVSVSSAPFWFWWLVPVVATAVVVAVVGLARRERRPRDGSEAVEEYARFRMAMAHVRGHDEERG